MNKEFKVGDIVYNIACGSGPNGISVSIEGHIVHKIENGVIFTKDMSVPGICPMHPEQPPVRVNNVSSVHLTTLEECLKWAEDHKDLYTSFDPNPFIHEYSNDELLKQFKNN